jgi:uncharacterized membrane protein
VDWVEFGVQWLHVIAAIFWFGGSMYMDFVVLPTLHRIPPASSRDVWRVLSPRMGMSMRLAAVIVIILGIVRGIAWGPRNAAGTGFDFSSQYGMTWSISIILALAIAAVGDGFIQRTARKLYSDDSLWTFATAGGPPSAAFSALTGRLRTGALVQLVLFIAVFTCMILMRFGF